MERFVNYAILSLAAPCTSVDATITVTNPTVLPTAGTYRVTVDDEIMMATMRTGAVVSVARGQEGTTAAAHGMGSPVQPVLTAAAFRQLLVDARAYEPLTCNSDTPTTAIYVDPANSSLAASDDNPGTALLPLLTTQFLNSVLFFKSLNGNTTIAYLSDDTSSFGLDYSKLDFNGATLTIQLTRVTLHTGGTLNAGTTTINPSAGGGGQRQLAHTSDVSDFSPYVIAAFSGSAAIPVRLVDTTAPNVDTGAWVASTIGHTVATANVSRPVASGFTAGSLASTNSYKLTRGGMLRLAQMPDITSDGGSASVVINDAAFPADSVGANGATYNRCSFGGPIVVGGIFLDCFGTTGFSDSGTCGRSVWSVGVLVVAPGDSFQAQLLIDGDAYLTGTTLQLMDFGYANVIFGPGIGSGVQIQDMTDGAGGITMGQVAQPVGIGGPNALVWGSGNAGGGFNFLAGAVLTCDHSSPPTVTGTLGAWVFTAKDGSLVTVARGIDDTGASPAYTTLRNNTWANFAAALGSGGFAFGAHCVDTGAAIIAS